MTDDSLRILHRFKDFSKGNVGEDARHMHSTRVSPRTGGIMKSGMPITPLLPLTTTAHTLRRKTSKRHLSQTNTSHFFKPSTSLALLSGQIMPIHPSEVNTSQQKHRVKGAAAFHRELGTPELAPNFGEEGSRRHKAASVMAI